MMPEFQIPDLPSNLDAEIRAERAREQVDRRRQQLHEIARLALRALGDEDHRPEWGAATREAIELKLKDVVPNGDAQAFFKGLDNRRPETMKLAIEDMFVGVVIDQVRSIIGEGRARKRGKRTEGKR